MFSEGRRCFLRSLLVGTLGAGLQWHPAGRAVTARRWLWGAGWLAAVSPEASFPAEANFRLYVGQLISSY